MDETEDPLIKAIMEAGLYGQRLQPFQQRAALGQQFMQTPGAQGAQVGNTYKAASPFEHLASALRQVIGGKMVGDAQQGQQDLTGQLAAGRQAYAKALQGMGGKTVSGDYGEPIRGVGADPQGMQRLAMLGALSGDPGMQHASQAALQERHLGIQESQMADMMRHRQILEGQGQQKIGQTERQQKTVFDAFNNPITVRAHGPALPGATAAAGGGGGPAATAPSGGGDPAKALPFGRGGPNQASIDKYAEVLAVTGQLPPSKWGKASAAINSAISNRMTELYPDAALAGNKAEYVSNTNSLRTMTKMSDGINAFETTALKNGHLMLDAAKQLIDTGSPFINQPVRSFMRKFAGDPKVAQFNAARQVFVQEAGKVLGGAVAGGVVSDSQRHEVDSLLSGDMTIPQMEATLQTLEADMANRKAATQAGLGAIRGRMTGKSASGAPQPSAATPAAPPPAGGAPALSPKDAQAVQAARERLKKNPQDATALEVLKLNGVSP